MGAISTANPASPSLAGTGPARSAALDVLRFAAALFVVLFSFGDAAPIPLFQLSSVFDRGYLATDFFLLLSGFVLARRHGAAVQAGEIGPTAFLARRVARIWPAHLIVLAAMAGLVTLAGGVADLAQIVPQALLMQAWGEFGGQGWNQPTWVLSALIICYAGFPIVWKLLARLPQFAALVLAGAVLVAVDVFVRMRISESLFTLPQQFGLLRALPLFVLGAAIGRATEGPPMPRWLAIYSILSGVGGLVFAQLANNAAISVFALALIIATLGSMAPGKPSRAAAWLGRLSFPLFITHILSATIWSGFVLALQPPAVLAWAGFAAAVGFALLFAAVFERFVDRPIQGVLSRALSARKAPEAATA